MATSAGDGSSPPLPLALYPDTSIEDPAPARGRVGLRTLRPEDLATLTFFNPPTEREAARPIAGVMWAGAISALDPKSSGGWAIVTADQDELVGLVIYHSVDARHDAAIISYGLELDARGLGLGTEAVGLAVERLMKAIGFETLFADVELTNVASRRLLQKVGFEPMTPGNTPGVETAPDRPAQRWLIGRRQWSTGRSLINLAPVGPL